jgi:hypothetical protein
MAECGLTSLLTTQSFVNVPFSFPKPDTDYSLELSVENDVDSPANLIWITLVTNRTTTGFTVWFNADAPTVNYKLRWCVAGTTPVAGVSATVPVLQYGDSFRIRGITGGVVFETFSGGVWTEVNRFMA